MKGHHFLNFKHPAFQTAGNNASGDMLCVNMTLPKRYFVAILASFGILLSTGYRAVFTIVMVYVLRENDTESQNISQKVMNKIYHNYLSN